MKFKDFSRIVKDQACIFQGPSITKSSIKSVITNFYWTLKILVIFRFLLKFYLKLISTVTWHFCYIQLLSASQAVAYVIARKKVGWGATAPPPILGCRKICLIRKFAAKNAKFGAKNTHFGK